MKHIVLATALVLSAMPLRAETPEGDVQEGFNLLERGAELLFRGLIQEVEPQLEEFSKEFEPAMRGLLEQMGPALNDLLDMIGEFDDYHAPEKLPNGDIIIRRKTPLPPEGTEL